MFRTPRLSPVVALNLLGFAASAMAVVVGLEVAGSNVRYPSGSPDGTDGTSSATTAHIEGGTLTLTPNDWESVPTFAHAARVVATFRLDRFEVTYGEWRACTTCGPLESTRPKNEPVVNVTPERAQTFCQHRNGRLPTRAEWVFAASAPANNRYPWGQTGLVCRKVVFGMVNGPCAFGQTAQAVGSRTLGATAAGVHDLAGNVAEWARDGNRYVALGGSFRSTLAGQLKVWAVEETETLRDDIGFRCAYDE